MIMKITEYPLTEMIGELTEMGAEIDGWTEREVREFYADTCDDPRGYLQTEPAGCPRCAAYHELRLIWVGEQTEQPAPSGSVRPRLLVPTSFTLVRQDDGDLVIAITKGDNHEGFESGWNAHCDSCGHDFYRDGFTV